MRRVQILVAVSAVAAVTAVMFPPLGLGLGVAVLVTAIVRRDDLTRAGLSRFGRAVPIIGGSFAVLTGGVMSLAMLIIGDELDDYQNCRSGANTHTAQQRCQNELTDALEERFGSW